MKRTETTAQEYSNDEEIIILPTKKRTIENIKNSKYLNDVGKYTPEQITTPDLAINCSTEFKNNILQFGQSIFHTNYKQTFVTRLIDYVIISNFNLNRHLATIPKKIKSQMVSRWIHSLHVRPSTQDLITRKMLQARSDGGQIVAYHYKEFSIEGNECVYFGFLPSTGITPSSGAHLRPVITTTQIWPRQLFVKLIKITACECSTNCVRVAIELFSTSLNLKMTQTIFCIKQVPWADIYLVMGDANTDSGELYKKNRICSVCAQCIKCSTMTTFCNAHRECKHKRVQVDAEYLTKVAIPSIKDCNRIIKK